MKFNVEDLRTLAASQKVSFPKMVEVVETALTDAYLKANPAVASSAESVKAQIDPAAGTLAIVADGVDVTPDNFGRLAATTTRGALVAWMRDQTRRKKVGVWESTVNTLVTGTVRTTPATSRRKELVVRIDAITGADPAVDAIVPPGEAVDGEKFAVGDKIRLFVLAANVDDRDIIRLAASRRQPAFVTALLQESCPPLRAGTIKIVAIARDPGSRVKIAVASDAAGIDPTSTLIGPGAAWIAPVAAAINPEKIDVVASSDDLAEFVAAALTPGKGIKAEVTDAHKRAVTARVAPDQLIAAAGREKSNVSLAKRLTGANITVVPDSSLA